MVGEREIEREREKGLIELMISRIFVQPEHMNESSIKCITYIHPSWRTCGRKYRSKKSMISILSSG